MLLGLFSVFDVKGKLFGLPFCMINEGLAVRLFTEVVNDGKSTESKYPSDYVLYKLGTFDQKDGQVVMDVPIALGHGSSFVYQKTPPPSLNGDQPTLEVVR